MGESNLATAAARVHTPVCCRCYPVFPLPMDSLLLHLLLTKGSMSVPRCGCSCWLRCAPARRNYSHSQHDVNFNLVYTRPHQSNRSIISTQLRFYISYSLLKCLQTISTSVSMWTTYLLAWSHLYTTSAHLWSLQETEANKHNNYSLPRCNKDNDLVWLLYNNNNNNNNKAYHSIHWRQPRESLPISTVVSSYSALQRGSHSRHICPHNPWGRVLAIPADRFLTFVSNPRDLYYRGY